MSFLSTLISFLPSTFQQQFGRTEEKQGATSARIPVTNTSRQYVSPSLAQGLSAVYGCIDYIARMIAVMPWRVIETTGDNDRILAFNHPIDPILSRSPNPEMTPFTLKHTILAQCLGWGNGYAEIVRDEQDRIRGLLPIESRRVSVCRNGATEIRATSGFPIGPREIYYSVSGCAGVMTVDLAAREMFHIMAMSNNGIVGRSPVLDGTQSIGTALAADRHAGAFFGNEALPVGVIETPEAMDQAARDEIRRVWAEIYGGVHNFGQTAVLHSGAKFNAITIDPETMQLLETRKFNVTEVCRFFGVPPQKIFELSGQGQTATAEINSTTVSECLLPWMTRLQETANWKLIGQPRFSTKLNAEALLRGTMEKRFQAYRIGKQQGFLSTNDIRRREDLPGIGEAGDVYLQPLNMTTAEKFASPDFVPNPSASGPGDGSSGGEMPESAEGGEAMSGDGDA